MLNISQTSTDPVHAVGDTLQMAQYNVRDLVRFVNEHAQQQKEGNLELVRHIDAQRKEGNLELVRHINAFKTQGFNDLMAAQIELGISKEKERLLQEQLSSVTANLNSVTAKKKVLSERIADITKGYDELSNSLKVERELKRSKTAEFNAQGAELNGIKNANLELTSANAKLRGELDSYQTTNKELADELVRLSDTVRIKITDYHELKAEFKDVELENDALKRRLLLVE